jgi:thioesterase domain-containing protein
MSPAELQDHLHAHILLTRAMQVSVVSFAPRAVVLAAPLEPNINHRDTVFGGSASALAMLPAWSPRRGRDNPAAWKSSAF